MHASLVHQLLKQVPCGDGRQLQADIQIRNKQSMARNMMVKMLCGAACMGRTLGQVSYA